MNWFKRSMWVGALAGAMGLAGCQQPAQVTKSSSSGSLALSADDAFLYAVDTDNGTLNVVDTKLDQKIASVKVGSQPGRVAVGSDDTIYVTNKGSNTVSVIRRGDWKEAATIDVGTEPAGIAVSPDNKMLYVVNATGRDNAEFGTMTAIDVATLQVKYEVNVGPEPRGIALIGNDRAVVTLYKQGELVEVDLVNHQLAQNGTTNVYAAANASKSSSTTFSSFKPRAMNDVVATPDGTRVFAPVIWAREDSIATPPNSFGGYYAAGGPCNVGAVATAGIVVADNGNGSTITPNTGSLSPQVDDLTACASSGTQSENKDFPTSVLAQGTTRGVSGDFDKVIQAPVAAAIDPTGTWVFLVNKESSNVAIVPAFRRSGEDIDFKSGGSSVRSVVWLNGNAKSAASSGPDGIALTRDGNKAYVYNQFDHRVDVLSAKDNFNTGQREVQKVSSIPVASDVLTPEVVAGRKLFFNAVDPQISAAGTNVSCATCHLEGGDDAHVWSFPDGPRQTPALAGRKIGQTAPFHWSGEFSDTQKFMTHTIKERMGGDGLQTAKDMQNMIDFVDSLPVPQNANLKTVRTDAQLRGAQVFQKAECGSCHTGALLTNRESRDVGTLVMSGTKKVDNGYVLTYLPGTSNRRGLDVPSLIGLARTGPYLHTGGQFSLTDRVNDNNPKHGRADLLNAQEKADLVEYLKTL